TRWRGLPTLDTIPKNIHASAATPSDFEKIVQYASRTFTPGIRDSWFPEEMIVRPTGEAARVVFTHWFLPPEFNDAPGAKTDSKGMIWFIAMGGGKENLCCLNAPEQKGVRFGGVGRLDPRTGEMKIWRSSEYAQLFEELIPEKLGSYLNFHDI